MCFVPSLRVDVHGEGASDVSVEEEEGKDPGVAGVGGGLCCCCFSCLRRVEGY